MRQFIGLTTWPWAAFVDSDVPRDGHSNRPVIFTNIEGTRAMIIKRELGEITCEGSQTAIGTRLTV